MFYKLKYNPQAEIYFSITWRNSPDDDDDDDDDINLRPRDLPKGIVLSLGFKYKVLFIKKPKTTRGKKTPL